MSTFEHQNEITGLTAERDWEKARADRLQERVAVLEDEVKRHPQEKIIQMQRRLAAFDDAVSVARDALVQIQNYYRGHPQQASIAEKALKEMGVPPAPPKRPEPRPFRKPG